MPAVDLAAQALKALSPRSPFDSLDPASSSSSSALPHRLAAAPPDPRRPLKKSSSSSAAAGGGGGGHPRRRTVWDSTAAYFSAVSPADVDLLTLPALRPADPSLTVPVFASAPAPAPAPSSSEAADAVADDDVENYTPSSINWLLGCRGRCHLTSERPNKKRRLLGTDAGLEQLLKLPYPDTDVRCDFCCLGGAVVRCGTCKVAVHRACYGVGEVDAIDWRCSWCEHWCKLGGSGRGLRQCVLCPREGGAVKPVASGAFAHLFCCMWTPEVYVEDVGAMEPILNVEGVNEARRRLVCNVCKVKHGFCVRCSEGTCRTSFHPLCARESKLRMEVWGKFGCDNVELRAFCSKHSGSHGNNSAKHSEKFRLKVAHTLSLAKPPPVILPMNVLHKIRLSDSVRDRTMAQGETTGSEDIVNNESTLVDDCEAQFLKGSDTCGVAGSGNKIAKNPTLAMFLRKLIEQGRVNVNDVASEMGIASNSLKAALVGQTSSFSPGLALKLMQWLQNHGHNLRIGTGSAIPLANGVSNMDCLDAAGVSDPLTDVKVANHDSQIPLVVESLPPPGRTESNSGILEEDKTSPSAVEVIQQNGSEMLVDETGETRAVFLGDVKKESHDIKSLPNQGACDNGLELSETILEATGKLVDHSSSVGLIAEFKGNSLEMESTELPESDKPTYVTGVSTCEPGIDQVDTANINASVALEKDCCVNLDCDINLGVSSDHHALIVGEPGSSYVHPFIQRRLMQVQVPVFSKQNHSEVCSVGDDQNVSCPADLDTLVTLNQEFNPIPTDKNHAFDAAKLDQLAKAKKMGILELSPEDEVEEEILYLQSRLVDKAVAIKHRFEALLPVLVENLPKELDVLNKRRWDMVHVTQFLCEIREAKKRGRKERKHKEAQAVLAAAVAAASPRITSQRKYVFDEIISTHPESRLNVSSAAGRARVSPLAPQAKVSSRVVKMSPYMHSGSFWLPDFPEENVLSCDICRRAEISSSRIFVCSSCKVAVHIDCYRTVEKPIISWKCELCEEITSLSRSPINGIVDCIGRQHVDVQCGLCAGGGGAFRKSTDGQWVHAFCAEWLMESRYERGQENLVDGMDTDLKEKDLHSCCICHRNVGVCLKCSCGHCQITFHPSCAKSIGLYMNVKSIGGKFQRKAYCEKHSLEQIEADRQRHGFEDLKTLKRLRVELEKVRLLCERIIKREKLKRDLFMCSHEVLASQRDYVAFSLLVHSSYIRPGASSESATTSVDNRSYSDAVERSDDITVDSTVSGEQSVRLSVNADADRKTDDSSTSQLSCKLKFSKISNRGSFGFKQLPRKAASASLWNSAEDREKMSNTRKRTQTFQEWVLTSNRAQMQNQRLPKGFAYDPVVCLPEEKPVIHDMDSCVPPEPGG